MDSEVRVPEDPEAHVVLLFTVSFFDSCWLHPIALDFFSYIFVSQCCSLEPHFDSHYHPAAMTWFAVLAHRHRECVLVSQSKLQHEVGLCTNESDRWQNTSAKTHTSSSS